MAYELWINLAVVCVGYLIGHRIGQGSAFTVYTDGYIDGAEDTFKTMVEKMKELEEEEERQ